MKVRTFAILLAVAVSGCASFQGFVSPGTEIRIVNNCRGSILVVLSSHLKHPVELRYGEDYPIFLSTSGLTIVESPAIMVKGYDETGERTPEHYLGSDTRNFATSENRVREVPWEVDRLSGGRGCGR